MADPCPYCNTPVPDAATFCPTCGEPTDVSRKDDDSESRSALRRFVFGGIQGPLIFVLAALVAGLVADLPFGLMMVGLGIGVYVLLYSYRAEPPVTDSPARTEWTCLFCDGSFLVKGGTHWWCEACGVYYSIHEDEGNHAISCYQCGCGAVMCHGTDHWLEFVPPHVLWHRFRLECHLCGQEPRARVVYRSPTPTRPARYYLEDLRPAARGGEVSPTVPGSEQARLHERWETIQRRGAIRRMLPQLMIWLLLAGMLASLVEMCASGSR